MSNNETIQAMLEKFLPFAQERLGFENLPEIRFENDEVNAQQPLGKTAYYDPSQSSVTVYVDGRHPKDIMRSISHELVHHTQNGRGEFDKVTTVGEGYAQSDDHLRNMEKEAYTEGNLCFRDWEDSIKTQNEELNMFEKRNKRLNESIMKKFGYVNEVAEAPYPRGYSTGVDDGKREADDAEQKARLGDALEAVLGWTLAGESEGVIQAAKELYWYEEWPDDVAEGNELEVALEKFGGERSFREDVRLELKYGLLQRQKAGGEVEEDLERVVDDAEEGEPVDTIECPDGTMIEKGLVGGKEGGTAECPKKEDSQQESIGFDKDFGDEFAYLFEDGYKESSTLEEETSDNGSDDDSEEDHRRDGGLEDGEDAETYLEEYGGGCEEEPAIVVTVGEGLYDSRNKLLHERLIKWSSK
jgi:hypothetical protein